MAKRQSRPPVGSPPRGTSGPTVSVSSFLSSCGCVGAGPVAKVLAIV